MKRPKVFRELAARTSPRHAQWRFDPIVFTGDLGVDYYERRFREIASALAGATRRCYFSFAVFYGKVARTILARCADEEEDGLIPVHLETKPQRSAARTRGRSANAGDQAASGR